MPKSFWTARVSGLALACAMAATALSGTAHADSIFGSSAIFTDRACTAAADISCVTANGIGPKLTPNQFYGGYGQTLSASAILAGGASTSATIDFGDDYLPSVHLASTAGSGTRTGASVTTFRSFTYNGAVDIDFAIAGLLHFVTSGDLGGGLPEYSEFAGDGQLNVALSLQRVSDILSQVGPGSDAVDLISAAFQFADCSSGAIAAGGYSSTGLAAGGYNTTVGLSQSCSGGAIVLHPGDSFVVVATLQAISNRGGVLNALNTFNVVFDEANTFVDSTHEAVAQGFLRQSISEGAAIPEPATWVMMIAGFGLAGAALRRRRIAIA